jgi:hypothetical protein
MIFWAQKKKAGINDTGIDNRRIMKKPENN